MEKPLREHLFSLPVQLEGCKSNKRRWIRHLQCYLQLYHFSFFLPLLEKQTDLLPLVLLGIKGLTENISQLCVHIIVLRKLHVVCKRKKILQHFSSRYGVTSCTQGWIQLSYTSSVLVFIFPALVIGFCIRVNVWIPRFSGTEWSIKKWGGLSLFNEPGNYSDTEEQK